MIRRFFLVILFAFPLFALNSFGQKKNLMTNGDLKGVVRDSAYNYVLPAASVTIYNEKDSILKYNLTDRLGEFYFNGLSFKTYCKIVISYVGYKPISIKLYEPDLINGGKIKVFNLERGENSLAEVKIVATPPVQMNGDTLEFNADAFKLDKNAVAEDLLRKLPGVILWGDGTVTVNGRQISGMKVNGKPFFGGDSKIATQNIPTDAIDKVQVYRVNRDPTNPLDSVSEINLKLKRNKQSGYFGKLGTGNGTSKKYEEDGNFSYFNPQTQLSIVGAANNTNKVPKDAEAILRNGTFKGIGTSIEYQPDFSKPGVNINKAAGLLFSHSLIPDYNSKHKEKISGSYFFNDGNNSVTSNKLITTALGLDGTLLQRNNSNSQVKEDHHQANIEYENNQENHTYSFSAGVNLRNSDSNGLQQDSTMGSKSGSESRQRKQDEAEIANQSFWFKTNYSHSKDIFLKNSAPGNFNIGYNIELSKDKLQQVTQTNFSSIDVNTQDQKIDRRYNNQSNGINQHLTGSAENFSDWLFGDASNFARGLTIGIQNDLEINVRQLNNQIFDFNNELSTYVPNDQLTVKGENTQITETPGINFSKTITKELSSRYQKSTTINIVVQEQYFNQHNSATQSFQNFEKSYRAFVPTAGIGWKNSQFGLFLQNINISFSTIATYPTVEQLFPLVDSSNVYYIHKGNSRLNSSKRNELGVYFNRASFRSKNTLNYFFNSQIGFAQRNISDSIVIDNLGRLTHYNVNLNGYKYANFSAGLNKAYKFHSNVLQINLRSSFNISKTPSYLNNEFIKSNTFLNTDSLNIYYAFKDWLAINLKEGYWIYRSVQSGRSSSIFESKNQFTTLSASVRPLKKLSISSNLTQNHNSFDGAPSVNFTIWNANAAYRFFSDNSLEFKVSALDLLHQNSSVISFGTPNRFTYGRVDVLQQYFMVTLSYFPRKFGKKKP